MATDTIKQEQRKQMLLNQPVGKVIFKMAIPTIIAFLISSIYSLADTYFVSGLGENATAAVSVNASLDQLIMMCGSMLAVGANSYIARLLGQGSNKKASQVLSTAFMIATGLSLLLTLFGNIFMEEMVTLLGATPTCKQYAIDYATYVLYAAPFMATSFVMNQCLRSEGSATLSMIGMGFGGILNCFLDPIFISGWEALGIPAMGVAGASLATLISKVVSFAILIFPYITRKSLLHLSIRNFHPSWDIISKIVSVGSSSMFRSGLAVVAGILLNREAGNISDGVLAGIGVTTKIMMFPFSIILGFGTGFQPVAGFNWGAKRYDRVMDSYRFASRAALIGSAVMAVLLGVFAEPVIGAFSNAENASEEMRQIGALCIRLQCIALPIHGWVALVNMLCAGLGNAGGALALSTSRQGSCFLPVLYPLVFFFGAYGIASVQAVADVLSLVLAIPIALYMVKKIRKAQELESSGQVQEV